MNYPFSGLVCKLVPFIQVSCVYVSTLTMGVIAIHRYYTVSGLQRSMGTASMGCHLGQMLERWHMCFIITGVSLFAAFLAIPHSMYNTIAYVEYQNVTYKRCRADYPRWKIDLPFWLSFEAFLTQYL